MAETVFILLGSNLGDRERQLAEARDKIGSISGLEVSAASSIYVSEAVDMKGENPSFLNQVVMGEYIFTPNELLASLERIEKQMGRINKGDYLPRPIDLDLLLFGEEEIDTGRLVVPHKKLLERGFALVPLTEIDPERIHPGTGRPLVEYVTDAHRASVILFREHVARSL